MTLWLIALIPFVSALADNPASTTVTVRSSMESDEPHIRQLAFDGDESTSFLSKNAVTGDDSFTLTLDAPVALHTVRLLAGTNEGAKGLDGGVIETSEDGKTFTELAIVSGPETTIQGKDRMVTVIRLRPKGEPKEPVAIREIILESTPPLARFSTPVEFLIDVGDAPEMADWAETAVKACERAYPMICEQLKSDAFQPPNIIRMRLKSDYNGVAEASGTRITGSVKFFKAHPDDIGAMVHETSHVVQRYRGGNNPSWLVEGVADYIRFFKYEPDKLGAINANRAHYNNSYRVSAAFLDYLNRTYDKSIVHDLNTLMREGQYNESFFEKRTGKTLPQLDEEWRATLKP